jgi:hypothetical protein
MDRSAFLAKVAAQWARLDLPRCPSVYEAGMQLREHDDREQRPAGIDLILASIQTVNRAAGKHTRRLPCTGRISRPATIHPRMRLLLTASKRRAGTATSRIATSQAA